MISAEEWHIITEYQGNVIALNEICMEIDTWARRGYPVPELVEHAQRLKLDILRFENILEQIPDRRAQNVLRSRYACGMTIAETAESMDISHGTVDKIIKQMKPAAPARE